MDKVNILYCFGSESWQLVAVSIESLLSNANPETHLTIYCMVEPGTKGHHKIKRVIKSHKINAELVWREIKPKENPLQNSPICQKHGPVQCYPLIAHRFFKDVNKMLYLNPFTLICRDLTELFNTDISDWALGAVYDMAPIHDANNSMGAYVRRFSEIYLNREPYYNGGVLLMNLEKLAADEHLMVEANIPLLYPAQDLLNAVFVGKIKRLPLKCNLVPGVVIPPQFSPQEVTEVTSGECIIVNCSYNPPYDKNHVNQLVFSTFDKFSRNIGMCTEQFMRAAEKHAEVKKTFVPHVTVRQGKILFFGMKI